MKNLIFALSFLILMQLLVGSAPVAAQEPEFNAQQLEFFERKVRPLLVDNCYSCHSSAAQKNKGGLLLDSRAAMLKGGDSGEAIVPGEVEESLLIGAVRYEDYEMPPKGQLSKEEISVFEKWIEMGAPWPAEEPGSEGLTIEKFDLEARRKEHWVWQPVTKPAIPDVDSERWSKHPIDRFVYDQLQSEQLKPSTQAEPLAIARRLHNDLIGLPMSTEELRQFQHDLTAGREVAIEKLVDRLLASPHFGERWARHWMDLVRYADSRGHEFDIEIPNAYQYRDYMVRALNQDVPYDQLIREHIAGDLLEKPRLRNQDGINESILGTGFWFLGEGAHSPVDIRKDEADRFDNMIDVASKSFLGVTVSCARCHDHKFDAISTADYYSLTGFLHSSDYRQVRFESIEPNKKVAAQLAELDHDFQIEIFQFLKEQGIESPRGTQDKNSGTTVDPQTQRKEGIVFDCASLSKSQYMQDGFIFGSHPTKAGQIYFGSENGFSTIKVASFGAAVSDPFWNGLESVDKEVKKSRSKIAQLPKSGRTLRTPTFELEAGNVACLVSGHGHVVACVDSHRLVHGPLHGETIVKFVETAKPNWVQLDLKRYLGHRLHLEFVPAEKEQVAVRLVIQGLGKERLSDLEQELETLDQDYLDFAEKVETMLNVVSVKRVVFEDFEQGYGDWISAGNSFGDSPKEFENIRQRKRLNGDNRFFVTSQKMKARGKKNHKATGTLTSSEFEIGCDIIEFRIGGGNIPAKTCLNLLVDGKPVRTATGDGQDEMSLKRWDVSDLKGETATFQVVDDSDDEKFGSILLDHIVFINRIETESKSNAQEIVQRWYAARERLSRNIVTTSKLAPAMLDGTGEEANIYVRGNSSNMGDLVPRHFLTAVDGGRPIKITRGSGRLELAKKINDPRNPLTSRVIVNRVWHYLLGRGIVPTTDDFGVLGQRPTHPQLLDHLATDFVADRQSIKRLIKQIVLTETYQMSSRPVAESLAADPSNLLWHHRPPKRMDGETIRDSLLALSGSLDRTMGGPPVPVHLTSFMEGRGRPKKSGPLDGQGRRSIYIAVRRNFLSPFMLTFDTPVPFSTMGRRNVSNVPAQSLILMNDPFVAQQAKTWGKRAIAFDEDFEKRITWMYQNAFARSPTESELKVSLQYVEDRNDLETWQNFAHALINTKEFIFLR